MDVSREEKRKLTRYGRFKDVFKRAIEECKASNIDHLTFTDSNVSPASRLTLRLR